MQAQSPGFLEEDGVSFAPLHLPHKCSEILALALQDSNPFLVLPALLCLELSPVPQCHWCG